MVAASILACGCTAGPEPPGHFGDPAIILNLRVLKPPVLSAGHGLVLKLDLVVDCYPMDWIADGDQDAPVVFPGAADGPIVRADDGEPERVAVGSATLAVPIGNSRCLNTNGSWLASGPKPLLVRHFRPRIVATLLPGDPAARVWTSSDRELVHAARPAAVFPFGPAGPHYEVPMGYSIVQRSCRPGGGFGDFTVTGLDTILEFNAAETVNPTGGILEPEDDAREFARRCGVPVPEIDLGSRLSLDPARRVVWSADQARLYYLVGEQDIASLRTVAVESGAPVELLSARLSDWLQIAANGDVFVLDSQKSMLRGHGQPAGPMAFQRLSFITGDASQSARVSPDGHWVAFTSTAVSGPTAILVRDFATNEEQTIGQGSLATWSPDSRRFAIHSVGLFWVRDLTNGQFSSLGSAGEMTWQPDGTVLLESRTGPGQHSVDVLRDGAQERFLFHTDPGLHVWSGSRLSNVNGFFNTTGKDRLAYNFGLGARTGLELDDPRGGGQRTLLPPAEALDVDQMRGTPDGKALVWTRGCLDVHHTLCFFKLHRLSLDTEGDQVIAVSRDRPVSAISPDGRKIAIATRHGVFVKDLP